MKSCLYCKTSLMDDAKFCHKCGAKAPVLNIPCPECGHHNPPEAIFCGDCGFHFVQKQQKIVNYTPRYPLDFSNTKGMAKEIMGHFINALENRIKEEHEAQQFGDYLDLFYDSGFNKHFQIRGEQLAEEVYTIHCRQNETVFQEIDTHLEYHFNALLDLFIIRYANHLLPFPVPEAILKYESVRQGEFELPEMIWDYLDTENEEENVYTNFILMPLTKLKNASQSFLFAATEEKILFICDQTVFGSCKEGFAMTDAGIYWKAHFEKAHKVYYRDLNEIKKQQDWITIEGYFFNVNPSLNWKVMKLLKKLKEIY